jgi:hypothetical protein
VGARRPAINGGSGRLGAAEVEAARVGGDALKEERRGRREKGRGAWRPGRR